MRRQAIDIFLSSPENKKLSKLRLMQKEWVVIEDILKILEVCGTIHVNLAEFC